MAQMEKKTKRRGLHLEQGKSHVLTSACHGYYKALVISRLPFKLASAETLKRHQSVRTDQSEREAGRQVNLC